MPDILDEYEKKLEGLKRDELESELERLKGDLEDLEVERRLIIGQTGVHINASKIQAYREAFDRDEKRLKRKIEMIERELEVRGSGAEGN